MKPSVFLFLVACGEPLIEPGAYNVDLVVVYTSDPFYEPGEISYAEWKLSEEDGAYKLDMNNNTVLKGEEKESAVIFDVYKELSSSCVSDFVHLKAELKPIDGGFRGSAGQALQFCSYYNPSTGEERTEFWATNYSITGTKKEE